MTQAQARPTTSTALREVQPLDISISESDGRHLLEVTLITAGTSKNGNHYPAEVLRAALPLFEGARAFVDHPKPGDPPERSVRDLAGYYSSVSLDQSGRVRAQLHLVPGNDWLFHLLREAEGNPNLCGLSIDAFGDAEPHGGERHVTALTSVASCDIVTKPAAGGAIDRILASDRGPQSPVAPGFNRGAGPDPRKDATLTIDTPTSNTPQSPDPSSPNPVRELTEGQSAAVPPDQGMQPGAGRQDLDLAALIEQQSQDLHRAHEELRRVRNILSPAPAGVTDPGADVAQLVEEIRRERDLARAGALLAARLQEAILPQPIEAKVAKRFSGRLFEVAELDSAITDEKVALAALTASGQITGMGFPDKTMSAGMAEIDQVQAAFDALFDVYESDGARQLPRLSGIREAFRLATGIDAGSASGIDRPLVESLQRGLRDKVRSGRLSESEAILREADVQTSTFSYLLGTSMNKRLMADYQAWPSEWQKFTTIVGIKDFKTQDRIRLGAFGSLSTVSEDAAYTTLTLADTHATYAATKRGNLVQITRETIINDDLYAIKQIPQKLAVAAAFTLAEFVYNLLAPNFGNIYDAHPLFDSVNHLNTGIAAANLNVAASGSTLSSNALQTAVVNMRKQKNMASKPIGLKPRFVLVPPDLEFTAMTILKSAGLPGGNNNDINPMMGYMEPIVSPQLNSLSAGPASTSIWIAVADPRVIDTLEVGFVGGQANPVLLIQDLPLYGINFTQDVISYKVRHEYGGAVVDYRGFYLGNN